MNMDLIIALENMKSPGNHNIFSGLSESQLQIGHHLHMFEKIVL